MTALIYPNGRLTDNEIVYYFNHLLDYSAASPMSIAHAINPPSLKGRAQANADLYYKYRTDLFHKEVAA